MQYADELTVVEVLEVYNKLVATQLAWSTQHASKAEGIIILALAELRERYQPTVDQLYADVQVLQDGGTDCTVFPKWYADLIAVHADLSYNHIYQEVASLVMAFETNTGRDRRILALEIEVAIRRYMDLQ